MNLPEDLCYWYLRLNGFFPLDRFVVHRGDDRKDPSDCDLLAIRPRFVYEEIGGRDGDWDPWLAKELDFGSATIGLICEVKGGTKEQAPRLTEAWWLEYATSRLGIFPLSRVDAALQVLGNRAIARCPGDIVLARLLCSQSRHENKPYLSLTLEQAEDFVRHRIRTYLNPKHSDRYFFDSILMQQLISEVEREARST